MELCLACQRGNHLLCLNEWEPCPCDHGIDPTRPNEHQQSEEARLEAADFGVDGISDGEPTRGRKNDYDLKDPQSTGRKRAAKLFPLDKERECEFANQVNAGAIPGLQGIDGCGIRSQSRIGRQQARHHLDYDTLNNSADNVVRICHSCHVQIHHVNDPLKDKFYEEKYGPAAARGLQRSYKKLKGKGEQ